MAERQGWSAIPRWSAAALLLVAAAATTTLTTTGAAHSHGPDHHHGSVLAADGDDHAPVAAAAPGAAMGAHEQGEGFVLAAGDDEPDVAGGRCTAAAPRRRYDVAAIAVEITLNRYLDHDPDGRMYVLERDLAAVRAEEASNRTARTSGTEPAVSLGLQGDAIQPLTLRVLPGECLQVRLRNELPDEEPVSFHLHGAQLVVADTGAPALANEPDAIATPGEVVTYEWAVPAGEPEGTHMVHSHGDRRPQTVHGLFGAVVVEPPGSTWIDGLTAEPGTTSWSAVVDPPGAPAFREFVVYYHEVGTESEAALGADGQPLPLVDPITSSYKPSGRALNYRSEPFMHRLQLQVDRGQVPDESLAYSSYAFGDPATPIMRAYVGEPVKQRVVHGGSEVFHVHHVHGGSIRWPRQPGMDPIPPITEVEKHPPLLPAASERTDSQSIGPSETFDVEPECGAGGCQQSVGDVLYHCHIAHHYLSGMWGMWRVYNTLQDGTASTDQLPPLAALPDRSDTVEPAVTSDRLAPQLRAAIQRSLPPRGVPADGDASVWDWTETDGVYLGEPAETRSWPGYTATATGRPALLFDPLDGRLAFPHLRPHLGKRPTFAPGHGPAPYLDPPEGPAVPPPGANDPRSVCPAGARVRELDITAIDVPIPLNSARHLVDPAGMLFVRREQRDEVLADPAARTPLVLRTNAAVDCVDLTLTSEVADAPHNGGLSKVNAHIHFVQFDVQGSDGVDAGFNYEQSIRPWTVESEPVAAAVPAATTRLPVADTGRFRPGALVMVGVDTADRSEVRTVAAVEDEALVLGEPLEHDHVAGERVTVEFVRYRWYPDVQFGTAFFHDHVNAIVSGRHGLWGAMVAEPPDATWHDPDTGEELLSGAIADIHTSAPVSVDVTGSFRELVAFLQDDNPVTSEGRSSGSSFGLRVEPLDARIAEDPATAFDSGRHGDPETPVLRAVAGDPVVLRSLVSATNDVHTLHIDGHGFRIEPWSDSSPFVATAHLGISERLDLVLPSAGGPARLPGDYLLRNGRTSKLLEGSWGLLRVLTTEDRDAPRPLPGAAAAPPGDQVCPPDAPVRRFAVTAVEAPLPMLDGDDGVMFVAADAARSDAPPEPLVLRATVGDCVEVELHNDTGRPVSFEPDLMVTDPTERAVGRNGGIAVPPGGQRTSRFHAHPDFGPATVLVLDGGDPLAGPANGAFAAVAVAEQGATFRDPVTGEPVGTGWLVDVVTADSGAYRDAVLLLQEGDVAIGTHVMPYRDAVQGAVGINYQAARSGSGATTASTGGGEAAADPTPATPVIEVHTGDPVRLRVLLPASEQAHVFTVEGHRWPIEDRAGASRVGSLQVGALGSITLDLEGGAGGPSGLAGDYLYGDHREPFREAGLWGLLRVRDRCDDDRSLQPLADTHRGCRSPALERTFGWAVLTMGSGGLALAVLVAARRRRPDLPDARSRPTSE